MKTQPVEQTTSPPKKSGSAQSVNTTPAGAGPTIQDVLSQLTTEQQEQLAAMPQDQQQQVIAAMMNQMTNGGG